MKKARVKVLRNKERQIKKELVLKEEKMYIPKNKKLRIEIIQLHYNVLVAGHKKILKIRELVVRNYWWLEVTMDIGKYVNKCELYQRIKNRIEVLARKLIVNKILEKP